MVTKLMTDDEQADATVQNTTLETIQDWLIAKVADSVPDAPEDIDVREPLASYGLSSLAAVSLTADLEDWLNLRLPPTLAWDYPTIESLARYLEAEVQQKRRAV
ncbi:MAG TPA: acyl carrier protein [Pyrinomonadaceae bacterium]|jgi:acyl carrier protein